MLDAIADRRRGARCDQLREEVATPASRAVEEIPPPFDQHLREGVPDSDPGRVGCRCSPASRRSRRRPRRSSHRRRGAGVDDQRQREALRDAARSAVAFLPWHRLFRRSRRFGVSGASAAALAVDGRGADSEPLNSAARRIETTRDVTGRNCVLVRRAPTLTDEERRRVRGRRQLLHPELGHRAGLDGCARRTRPDCSTPKRARRATLLDGRGVLRGTTG